MVYVSRDKDGKIFAVYSSIQIGAAEELLSIDEDEVLMFFSNLI